MKIDIVDWKLIGACNLECRHCWGPPKTEKALPQESLFVLIERFVEIGVHWVVLTGGEPLVVPCIDAVLERLHRRGLSVSLSTNTSFFRRHQSAIEAFVSSLNIPLDGSTPAIHARSREDETSYHTCFDVLRHYQCHPSVKPEVLRVGSVYSKATQGDFLAMAECLEPFAEVIDTWKIYELIDYEFQRRLRHPILHEEGTFGAEMAQLLNQTSLASKIVLTPAGSGDRAYFLVNPRGHVVMPTDIHGVTHEVFVGDLLQTPLADVVSRWEASVHADRYCLNHRQHYEKAHARLFPA